MALAYTKEFLINAYLSRFKGINVDNLEKNASDLYDTVGKDKFRQYASLDAKALKKYKSEIL